MRHKRDPDATADVGRSFGQWFHSRADRDFYAKSNEPYPVFIVAAAGGGAYAAHYTATFLARMQDSCPNFAQHVFAISGVSGGSIGASLFAGLAKLKARNQPYVGCNLNSGDRYFERRTQKFFEQDFLSPVMAAALFPDLLQRFLPFPIGPFDRSRALDASIEAAWHDMIEDAAKEDASAKAHSEPVRAPVPRSVDAGAGRRGGAGADHQHDRGGERLPHRDVADRHGRAGQQAVVEDRAPALAAAAEPRTRASSPTSSSRPRPA